MATGRTMLKYLRAYVNGYDLSGYARQVGPLVHEFEEAGGRGALTDEVNGALPNQAKITPSMINAFLDNTASVGVHVAFKDNAGLCTYLFPQGIRAAPAQGDPAFMGQAEQLNYLGVEQDGFMAVNLAFAPSVRGATLLYDQPWGTLLHAKGTETAVNAATGVDDNGAASALGGMMVYQLFSSDGTVTLKVQDAATNADGSFADLSGATSGSIDASSTPVAGLVALGKTATVRRYLRWQLVLGTATMLNFALGFVRANR